MFHFAASEVKMSEEAFAERSAGADCLRDLIRRAKKHMSPKVKIMRNETNSGIKKTCHQAYRHGNFRIKYGLTWLLVSRKRQNPGEAD